MSSRRRLGALAVAFLVAGCGAEVAAPRPATSSPAVSATDTPRPTIASNDILYLRSNSGSGAKILVTDARTGQTVRTVNDGAVSPDGATIYWPEPVSGATKTTIHVADLASGVEIRGFTVDGDLRPAGSPETFSPLAGDARLTKDGRHLALMSVPSKLNGDWITRLAVVNTVTGAVESSAELRGQSTYAFIAFAPDARSVFLEQYGDGATRTRVFDVATGRLLDPSGEGLTTTGYRGAGLLSPDGRWMFRLDTGGPTTNCTSADGPSCVPNGTPPYIVALDLATRRAVKLALPAAQTSADFEKYMLWSLALTPDGSTLYAVDPALGVIDEVDARAMTLRRTATITVARDGRDDLLAGVARFFFPVAEAKRYLIGGALLSPDGRTLYAAAHDGLAVIDTGSLVSRAVWQPSHQFDQLRLGADGRRVYGIDNMAGRLVLLDAASGASLGEVKLPYVSAILRIDGRP